VRVRVIGIGTPHGDDAAGLAVVDALRRAGLPRDVDATTCMRPGVDLPQVLGNVPAAVLVDAMRSGRPPGSVARLGRSALPRRRALSAHGLGVAEGLALAEALGWQPERLELVGVEAGDAAGDVLSTAVEHGLGHAVELVRRLAQELAGIPHA